MHSDYWLPLTLSTLGTLLFVFLYAWLNKKAKKINNEEEDEDYLSDSSSLITSTEGAVSTLHTSADFTRLGPTRRRLRCRRQSAGDRQAWIEKMLE